MHCDNTSAINLTKNLIQHSRTKHIEIMYHFVRNHVGKRHIDIRFIDIDYQLADIFIKSFPKDKFTTIRKESGLCRP